jgi:hypothetical protein
MHKYRQLQSVSFIYNDLEFQKMCNSCAWNMKWSVIEISTIYFRAKARTLTIVLGTSSWQQVSKLDQSLIG